MGDTDDVLARVAVWQAAIEARDAAAADEVLHPDTAAVLSLATQHATVLGHDRSGRFVLSDIWLRQDGGPCTSSPTEVSV